MRKNLRSANECPLVADSGAASYISSSAELAMFIRYQLRSGERGGARASTTSGDGCLESRAAPRGSIPCARKAAPTLAPRSTDSQAGTLGGYGISGPRRRADTGGRANTLSATLFAARNRVPSEARQREGGLIKRPRTEHTRVYL